MPSRARSSLRLPVSPSRSSTSGTGCPPGQLRTACSDSGTSARKPSLWQPASHSGPDAAGSGPDGQPSCPDCLACWDCLSCRSCPDWLACRDCRSCRSCPDWLACRDCPSCRSCRSCPSCPGSAGSRVLRLARVTRMPRILRGFVCKSWRGKCSRDEHGGQAPQQFHLQPLCPIGPATSQVPIGRCEVSLHPGSPEGVGTSQGTRSTGTALIPRRSGGGWHTHIDAEGKGGASLGRGHTSGSRLGVVLNAASVELEGGTPPLRLDPRPGRERRRPAAARRSTARLRSSQTFGHAHARPDRGVGTACLIGQVSSTKVQPLSD